MKEFKVGDRVWSPVHGNGEVFEVVESPHDGYPVEVEFDSCRETYTTKGELDGSDAAPTLFHGHDLILEAKEPKKVWSNIYWDARKKELWAGAVCVSQEEATDNRLRFSNKRYLKTVELSVPESD